MGAFLENNSAPLVIDADAINIIAKHPEYLAHLPEKSIFTPHPKELERLIGAWKDDFEKIEKTKAFSKEHECIVVIKGANTITVFKDFLFVNNSGNPGMATAGSGDVLAGMLAGLLSQGYDPLYGTIFGVYLHGTAGDLVSQQYGFESLLAGDIVDHIGKAFMDLFATPPPQHQPRES